MDKESTYQSVFGEVKINRAYYWRKAEKGFFPLDAELILPDRRWRPKPYHSMDDREMERLTEFLKSKELL